MKRLSCLILLCGILFSSCHHVFKDRVRGNGIIKSENRTAGTFTSAEVHGNIDLYVKQDSGRTIRVETDENLLEYIEVHMEGETLVIEPEDGFNLKGSKAIKVYVSSPMFRKLSATGACSIKGENKITSTEMVDIDLTGASDAVLELKAPKVETELSGASSVELRGETKDFYAGGSGSSDLNCFGLMAENVDVHVSGASSADVFASVKLDARASGASDVNYKGNATVNKSESGASSVKKVD